MALHLKLEIRARCERHPRYNPAVGGEAAIRGGCSSCVSLLELYNTTAAANRAAELIAANQKDLGARMSVRWRKPA